MLNIIINCTATTHITVITTKLKTYAQTQSSVSMTVLSDISVFHFVTNCHQNEPSLYIISYTILKNSSLPFTFILSTSSPQLTTLASCKGRHIRSTGRPSMCDTTSCPDSTCPNTTCTLQQDVKTRFNTLTALCFFT